MKLLTAKYNKKKIVSAVIFLLLAFNLYSEEQQAEGYSGNDAEIYQQLTLEEKREIALIINRNFADALAASGFFLVDFAVHYLEAAEEAERMYGYSISSEIAQFDIIESETSGFFSNISIVFTLENRNNNSVRNLNVSAIGWGRDRGEAISSGLKKITNQFRYAVALFEELAGAFRIADIYHGTVVVNAGRNRGIRRGDFLYSYDHRTGRRTGNFVVERSEDNLSFAKILNTRVRPRTGDVLKSYNYWGIITKPYVNYFFSADFSGFLAGNMVIWTRGLFGYNPVFGFNKLNLTDTRDSSLTLISPYFGFRVVRYISSFSLSAIAALNFAYLLESDIQEVSSGWEYFGGTVKLDVGKRITKHFSIHLEGGFLGMFVINHRNNPDLWDIMGFTVGAGVGLKF
ncbi:MAG: hypothetical protein FWC36_04250 [Spirochaetes bacterium]|nr:hypothetical protein [Spirochaetota bacterium]